MRTSAVPVLSFGIAMMMQSAALAQTEVARGLSASATMLASYEDNVFRSLEGVAAGRTSSDFRITPSIFARYDLPVAGQGYFVDGAAGYNLYTKHERFTPGWWGLGAGVTWARGARCTGMAEAR